MPEYLRRTAVTRLEVTDEAAAELDEMINEWQKAADLAAAIGWGCGEVDKTTLQSMAYEKLREETSLGSQHTILAIREAADALNSCIKRRRDGREVSQPQFSSPTVTYDSRTMTVFEDEEVVSLSTTGDRIRCNLVLPSSNDGYQQKYFNGDWELTESTLTARDGAYFLHIGFRKPEPTTETSKSTTAGRTVLGVDLGIENIAVTSTAQFVSGRELQHWHQQFERVAGSLQQTGTESAHRTYVQRGSAEKRYNRDYIHRVANAIVEEAIEYGCRCIVFEDLKYIRDSMPGAQKFHRWAHNQLVRYVRYKGEESGINVMFVNPEDTSRQCSECGHTSKQNRQSRNLFQCKECSATAHADYNAAKNIGLRYVRHGQQFSGRTGERRLALKSGTVKPDQGFAPYSAEDTDKSVPQEATRSG